MPEEAEGGGRFWTRQELRFRQFEALGEDLVRERLGKGRYSGDMAVRAKEWLSRFDAVEDAARAKRRDEISEESLLEVRKANDIAERALANAKTANTIATLASIIAVVAIAISIVTAFVSD